MQQYLCIFKTIKENYSDLLELQLPVIYINLDNRVDRKEHIEKELHEMGLSFERFSAIKESFGALGCSKSHLEVLKLAKKKGYKQVLILEDDFTFIVDKNTFIDTMNQVLVKHFDVCMISYNIFSSSIDADPIWKKMFDGQTLSGYIVKDHYYDTLIQNIEESIVQLSSTQNRPLYAVDMYIKKLQPSGKWYHTTIRLGIQNPSYSDIEGHHVNYGL